MNQPRSQGVSSLPPLSFRARKVLGRWGKGPEEQMMPTNFKDQAIS